MHDFLTGNCGDQNFHIIGTGSVWASLGVIETPIYKVREVYGHPRGIIVGHMRYGKCMGTRRSAIFKKWI